MTEAEKIAWIDQASYEELLRKWRFAPVGDPWFQGKVGEHYVKMMAERKRAEEVAETLLTGKETDIGCRTSKRVGWDKP